MNFQKLLSMYSKPIRMAEEIGNAGALKLVKREGHIDFYWNNSGLTQQTAYFFQKQIRASRADTIEMFLLAEVFSRGPKLFRPSRYDFEILEEMNLNITFEDYVQPFETVVIELPDHYIAKKRTANPQAGQRVYGTVHAEFHEPSMVIIHHNSTLLTVFVGVIFDSGLSIKVSFAPDPDTIMEDYIRDISYDDSFRNTLAVSDAEWDIVRDVCRSTLNYCLLVDEIGAKRVGPINPDHYQRLIGYREKAMKSGDQDRIRKAVADCRIQPIIYELKQEVQLVDYETTPCEIGEPTGRTVEPHWRRGHYKRQHYGPGNSLVKRIRINKTLVNAHLYKGSMKDAVATYKA